MMMMMLRRIYIHEYEDDIWDEDDDHDIDGLNVTNCCEVLIIGNNLKSFTYNGDCMNKYFLHRSTLVTDASIEVQEPPECYLDSGNIWEIGLPFELSQPRSIQISQNAPKCGETFYV
ncbi:hypothetical protein PIB30_030616 [Stylosanthes scabra]|uniref:Uncharacterized protein n=1 Tax=Stylosanthes scabra TaxID=79078 RepID=A0ABU6XDH6_9FABA|nr:hypothetical protein [Stylosanthes scabra]